MRLALSFLLSCLFFSTLFAQKDPILMTVNGENITRSEFEYLYNKNSSLQAAEVADLDTYVDLFINFKLKVNAAKKIGYDTLTSFKNEFEGYKRQIAKSYLVDESINEQAAKEYYTHISKKAYSGNVQVAHIFKYLPQNITSRQYEATKDQFNSIYQSINASPDIDFEELVQLYSDDKRTFWVSALQSPVEFEEAVFNKNKGDVTEPFCTPQGIHIVKILDTTPLGSFEEMKDGLIALFNTKSGLNKAIETSVSKLKQEYGFRLNQPVYSLLLSGKDAQGVLFFLDNKSYDCTQFLKFAQGHPASVQQQINDFINKTVLDYEYTQLETKHADFKYLMQEYQDGMLLFEISNNLIWEKAMADVAGQKAFFDTHKAKYKWSEPKFNGIVVKATSKKVGKQIKKMIKNKPVEDWKQAVANSFSKEEVQVEQGLFSKGDNLYVDALHFKAAKLSQSKDCPYTFVFGQKQKGPTSYLSVRGELISDYQNYLEALWVKQLRNDASIQINPEVLKTVNNH